jgi:NADH:ubiquinone oxidoreductase subunit 6 (subunit J)
MNLGSTIFYCFITTAMVSALAILFSKNIFKAALWFLICLLSIAALFIMSFAEFVGVTQILIYAGGVLVIILFGIMFTSRLTGKPLRVENKNLFVGVLVGASIFILLAKLILSHVPDLGTNSQRPEHSVETIGKSLMTDYSLPFEVVAILLLITLVGASVVMAFMKLKRS